jgi:hypothetical protein
VDGSQEGQRHEKRDTPRSRRKGHGNQPRQRSERDRHHTDERRRQGRTRHEDGGRSSQRDDEGRREARKQGRGGQQQIQHERARRGREGARRRLDTGEPAHEDDVSRRDRQPGGDGRRRGHREEGTNKRRAGPRTQSGSTSGDKRIKTGGPKRGSPPQVAREPKERRPPRPALPEERPKLTGDVYRELRATTRPSGLVDVMRAVAAASDAIEEGDLDRATELLTWAKNVAARSAVIREALGVTRYLAGDFVGANRELLAYRRLSGRQDQNHLLADCARAAGRSEKVAEYVDEMVRAGAPAERVAEGLLVLAGERADRGDLRGSIRALELAGLDARRIQPWHPRLWYFAGDMYERLGDLEAARHYFEAIATVEDDFFDANERLAALSMRDEGDQCAE